MNCLATYHINIDGKPNLNMELFLLHLSVQISKYCIICSIVDQAAFLYIIWLSMRKANDQIMTHG